MKKYTNFYETVQEARMRLENTIVLYDGEPHYVLCILNHKDDGVFRGYLDPIVEGEQPYFRTHTVPVSADYMTDSERGQVLDTWLEKNPGAPIVRKMMNSPKFDRFRPFPLGMMNSGGLVAYVERSPVRHTQQGLTDNMLVPTVLAVHDPEKLAKGRQRVSMFSPNLYSVIKGIYPSVDECLTNLTDPEIVNISTGFHREFAFARGPAGLIFLAYRRDIIGFLPYSNLSEVKVSKEYEYVKESIDELGIFAKIS